MEFGLNDLKMFISTLWYDNVDDYDFFRLENVLPLKVYWNLSVFLIIWKKKWIKKNVVR